MKATARAHANIALVKYWGKRDGPLNLPTNGSLSLTLDGLATTTTVSWEPGLAADEGRFDLCELAGPELAKISRFLDRVRAMRGWEHRARVETANDFPTAAGLASSASGFAALAAAATWAAGLDPAPRELSTLARQGSGSASRSIFGGFALWHRGELADGSDSYAEQVLAPEAWDVRMLVTILEAGPKAVASREGMNRTVATSPMYPAWLATVEADLVAMREAVAARDLEAVGTLAEASCLKMHATMLTSQPPILYWQGATMALMQHVTRLRAAGLACWFTIDAGPNVKVLCAGQDAARVAAELGSVPGVQRVIPCAPGSGVQRL